MGGHMSSKWPFDLILNKKKDGHIWNCIVKLHAALIETAYSIETDGQKLKLLQFKIERS